MPIITTRLTARRIVLNPRSPGRLAIDLRATRGAICFRLKASRSTIPTSLNELHLRPIRAVVQSPERSKNSWVERAMRAWIGTGTGFVFLERLTQGCGRRLTAEQLDQGSSADEGVRPPLVEEAQRHRHGDRGTNITSSNIEGEDRIRIAGDLQSEPVVIGAGTRRRHKY